MRPRTHNLDKRLPQNMYYNEKRGYHFYGPTADSDGKPVYKGLGRDLDEARRLYGQINRERAPVRARRFPMTYRVGVIYVAQAGAGGPLKIGFTASEDTVRRRLKELQTGCPVPIRLLGVAAGSTKCEGRAHERLAKHRATGEWFHPVPDVLRYLEEVLKLDGTYGHESP